ncbi:hypothetical protein BJ742DRAFT_768004 [Cladochytrium replicatum]|nr:hypothetical protein BJ742DRAFT_768004 [Cladochytrium replicatum]
MDSGEIAVKQAQALRETEAVDQKKEDFRKYLERNGIIDALTKVLVGLYEEPEKPENPVDFIKQFLGGPSDLDVDALRRENEELKRKVQELEARLEEITNPPVEQGDTTAAPAGSEAAPQ